MADLDKTDLKTIEGIGPGMEAKLQNLSIKTVADLAARTDPDDLATLLESRQVTAERVRQWIAAASTPAGDVSAAEVVASARVVTPHTEVVVALPIEPIAKPPKVTEPTLHQLNMQSQAIDRQHKALRDEAIAAADEAATKALRGIAKLHRPRRMQKNLRPLVR